MGHGQARARALIAAAALLLCGGASPDFPLREARWLQSPDLVADLTHQPVECRSRYADPALERSAQIGRIAFHAPLLLGGQAARVGLSCSSCHRNGRTNAHFHFPGISGDPGTADVTASLMSSHRGDGVFNPKPIPDLAGDPARFKISRDTGKDDLKRFVHGLITQEFDGPEPPPAVIDGLVAYVRSLSAAACGHQDSTIRLAAMLEDVDTAVRLAQQTYASGDVPTTRVLIAAARSTLGKIDERFEVPGLDAARAVLRESDADLKLIELPNSASVEPFRVWDSRWPARKRALRAAEAKSLYSEAVLRRVLVN
jgi:hypothetical protein